MVCSWAFSARVKAADLVLSAIDVLVLVTIAAIIRGGSPAMAKRRNAKLRADAPKPSRGRPPVHQEKWSKVSVVLFDRQILHLDRLSTEIRSTNRKVLNRAEIIRALIDG